mmetsp:Transcript_8161/g.25932  ORF Transcript_8161/g.25932 Transcript_8161/m.25932 type:complete len:301 (-) Transcript_8161:491-1393(-)
MVREPGDQLGPLLSPGGHGLCHDQPDAQGPARSFGQHALRALHPLVRLRLRGTRVPAGWCGRGGGAGRCVAPNPGPRDVLRPQGASALLLHLRPAGQLPAVGRAPGEDHYDRLRGGQVQELYLPCLLQPRLRPCGGAPGHFVHQAARASRPALQIFLHLAVERAFLVVPARGAQVHFVPDAGAGQVEQDDPCHAHGQVDLVQDVPYLRLRRCRGHWPRRDYVHAQQQRRRRREGGGGDQPVWHHFDCRLPHVRLVHEPVAGPPFQGVQNELVPDDAGCELVQLLLLVRLAARERRVVLCL